MSNPRATKPDWMPWAKSAAAIAFLVLVIAFVADGCRACADLCSGRGEAWHWNAGDGLPPIVDACTCVGADGAMRRVSVTRQPGSPTGGSLTPTP